MGLLGGTFNPPHLGHLTIARHARDELGLARVLLTPARIPPHKPSWQDPGTEHRLAMCRLLVGNTSRLAVCTREMERDGPSYTVDTVSGIHASHPDVELTFIVGADIARTLPAWREPEKLLWLADLAVVERAGTERQAVLDAVAGLKRGAVGDSIGASSSAVRFLDISTIDVSSSMARERAARGEAIDDLVGDAVAGYIAEHRLYGSRLRAHG